MWYPVAGTTVPYLRNCGTRLLEQWCNSGRNLQKVLTDLRASLFFIIFFKRKELTTNAPSFAVRRQFLLLSRKRRGLEVARRIFLVQSQRNQWLSRFACTKGAAGFEPRGAFSWCKADVINGFPGLLAPRPTPVSGGAAHFLGAKPT